MPSELICDRTLQDIMEKTAKGYYNYNDINRVEEWCVYVANKLNLYNYFIIIETKTNWTRNDFLTISQLNRIKNNIDLMKEIYYVYRDTPNLSYEGNMNYEEANKIEKILIDVDSILNKMIASFKSCGTFACNEMRGLD